MLQKSLIIIPTHDDPRVICDFLLQTSRILTQSKNKVLIIEKKHYVNWRKLFKQKLFFLDKKEQVFYYRYFYVIPKKIAFLFSKNTYKKLNNQLNYLISEIITLLLSIKKKVYYWVFDLKIDYPKINFVKKIIILDIVDYFDFKEHQKKIEKADFVFVNSLTLQKLIKKFSKKQSILVPQGFSHQEFNVKTKNKKSKKPVIGFVGGVNNRLDYQILIPLIRSLKNIDFVFVGPTTQDPKIKKNKNKEIKKMLSLSNVKHQKPISKEKISKKISSFDICVIPYDINEKFNLYCYPMKLFEYFYLGKPVIATPIKELKNKKFKNLVKIGKNANEWEKHIKKLFKEPWNKNHQKKQHQLAIDNSWENKLKIIGQHVGN